MNKDSSSRPEAEKSPRLLLIILALALLAGALAQYWNVQESSPAVKEPRQAEEPRSQDPALPAVSTPVIPQYPISTDESDILPLPPLPADATPDDNAPQTPQAVLPEAKTDDAQAASENPQANEQKAPGLTQETPLPAPPTTDKPEQQTDEPARDQNLESDVILYGKGKALNREGSAVRGDIPADQRPLSRPGSGGGAPLRGDSLIGPAFVMDLALFLADNYWPTGSHPMAVNRGISTAAAKLVNMRYGMRLVGFNGGNEDPAKTRQRILDYALAPSMTRSLYSLYADSFFTSLENQALDRSSGPQGVFFTNAQMTAFFDQYAGMARSLAGCATAIRDNPGIENQVRSYAAAHQAANLALDSFMASMSLSRDEQAHAEEVYYNAVRERESGREKLVVALGRDAGHGLDADSRVYATLWLYRRGPDNKALLQALEDICLDAARRLDVLAARYKELPGNQIARP
ncbi:hypothetical protein LJB81_01680 [Desulfovibrio sp. OttesenSCG-928-M14]|nr:hypothetical protein [Desulfovibrio sp. OttesenSCG-928-M14]